MRIDRRSALVAIVACVATFSFPSSAVDIEQYFPAVSSGQQPAPESGWRIKYDILKSGQHSYGRSAILHFYSIEFMRGNKRDGKADWVKILNNLALAEIYV